MGLNYGPSIVKGGLVLALDAKDINSYPGSGTTWFDISGNNKNFSWGSVSWNPSGYFNTSGRVASGPASNSFGIDNNSGYTIFTVFKTVSAGANGLFKFFGAASRGIFVHPGWYNETLYFDQGGCCAANQRLNVTVTGLYGSWSIVAFRSTVAQRNIFYNGSLIATESTTAANIDLNSNALLLNPGDEGYNWDGQLAYFSVYNRGLTQNEYDQNYKVLKSRFSL